jgi:hypothetical protein
MALGNRRVWRSSTSDLTGCHKKTVGDGEKLLTYFKSVLKILLGTDSLLRVPKNVTFLSSEICKYTQFFTLFSQLTCLSQKTRW